MNRIATWLSILSLVLVGLLYYFHFTHADGSKFKLNSRVSDSSSSIKSGDFRVAYFEMDSVDKNYEYAKYIREALKRKESELNSELNNLKAKYQRTMMEWQKKGSNISQAESDQMNREYERMRENYSAKEKALTDEYETVKYNMYVDANKRISEFLKDYNKDKGYSYIIADQSNLFYYKDTVYNITHELISGLNTLYKQDKKK